VALLYTVKANLIFKWLRYPKYWSIPQTGAEESGLRFQPVEIVAEAKAPLACPVADSCIEIELAVGQAGCLPGSWRSVRAQGTAEPPTVIEIDDWSWRKSQTYGTIIVDLERRVSLTFSRIEMLSRSPTG
jgi:hypothetical protein